MRAAMRNLLAAFIVLLPAVLAGAAGAAPVKLVAYGDSLTAGYGLPPEEGFVPQLQAWLTDHGADVTVINAGVSGDTTADGLARIDWVLQPDTQAVILTLGGNDLLRGLPPAGARDNLDAILTRTGSAGLPVLLVPISAPGNYGEAYKAEFDRIYPDLAAAHGAMLATPFLAPIVTQPDRARALASFVQADGIHPNAEGVALVVEALGPQVLELLAKVK